MNKRIPQALRTWFFIHFLVDIFFAIPLLFFPAWSLRLLGFMIIEPLTTRLVGAALLAIGGISLLSYRQGKERFDVLLTLKIIWSISAIIAIFLSLAEGAPAAVFGILALFAFFSAVWIYYKIQLHKNNH